jgi:hypothetical protein
MIFRSRCVTTTQLKKCRVVAEKWTSGNSYIPCNTRLKPQPPVRGLLYLQCVRRWGAVTTSWLTLQLRWARGGCGDTWRQNRTPPLPPLAPGLIITVITPQRSILLPPSRKLLRKLEGVHASVPCVEAGARPSDPKWGSLFNFLNLEKEAVKWRIHWAQTWLYITVLHLVASPSKTLFISV